MFIIWCSELKVPAGLHKHSEVELFIYSGKNDMLKRESEHCVRVCLCLSGITLEDLSIVSNELLI